MWVYQLEDRVSQDRKILADGKLTHDHCSVHYCKSLGNFDYIFIHRSEDC